MNHMADTVVKRNNEMEKEIERKVMRYQLEKEDKDEREENRRKQHMRRRHEEIKTTLDKQLQERVLQKQQENYMNEQFMKQWNNMTDEADRRRKDLEDKKKQEKLQVKDFLLMQMGAEPAPNDKMSAQGGAGPSMVSLSKKKKGDTN